MKLLIVDDERSSREGLCNSIDWSKAGITSVGTARNGFDALHMIQTSPPNLVITDIRMPGMDGLELATQITHLHPGLPIILLSAYADFSYARSAISLGVSSYLLKPIEVPQLLEIVRTLVDNIRLKHQTAGSIAPKEECLVSWLCERQPIPSSFLNVEKIGVVLLRLENNCSSQVVYDSVYAEVERLFLSFVQPFGKWHSAPLADRCTLAFVVELSTAEAYSTLVEQLPSIVKAVFARTVDQTGAIGGSISDVFPTSDGPQALQQAMQALSYLFFLGKDAFVTAADTNSYSAEPLAQVNALRKRLLEALEWRSIDECLVTLQAFHDMFRFGAPADIPIIETTCRTILQFLGERFKSESVSQLLHLQFGFPRESYTLDEWFSYLETCYCAVFDLLAHGSQSKNSQLVHTMKALAQQHYTDVNLSMSWLAEKMERNPNYLSHVFSSNERTSFTDYIASLRIEHARKLLLRTNLASYEIAEQSGFANYRYFSQVFKKIVGATPSQYRNDH